MEEMILYGCKLAKEMEQNLAVLSVEQTETLLASCQEIIDTFSHVRERLVVSQGKMMSDRSSGSGGGGIHEWLRTGGGATTTTTSPLPEPMDLVMRAQAVIGDSNKFYYECGKMKGPPPPSGHGGGHEIQSRTHVLDPIRTSPQQRQPRKRKNEGEKVVTRVAAPQMGNVDLPPEDGYTWRKYGQKEILGSKYPRSYYRCTHQKFYDCPAKKQVQRLDDDPFTFEITYRGTHTCHMSSTAPCPLPPLISGPLCHPLPRLSASGSSMDLIFSSMDQTWDSEANKG